QGDHPGDEFGLVAVDRDLGSAGGDEPDEVQLLGPCGQDPARVADRHPIPPGDQLVVQERQPDVEAGGPHDAVVVPRHPIGKVRSLALEPADAGHNPDAAVVNPVQQQVVDRDGTSGEGAYLGGGQAGVVGVLPDRYASQQAADEVLVLRAEL